MFVGWLINFVIDKFDEGVLLKVKVSGLFMSMNNWMSVMKNIGVVSLIIIKMNIIFLENLNFSFEAILVI